MFIVSYGSNLIFMFTLYLNCNFFTDFIKWLVAEERNTKCRFIRPRGRFKRTSYTGIDYTCSQNRHFQSPRLRSSKTEDSEKTRYHCTAQILVKEFKDHVEALYFKRHYKHDSFFNSPKLIIRRKKTRVEKKIDNIANVCETALSPTDNQYSSESDGIDVTDTSFSNSRDLYMDSLIKQLSTIHSKLLSKTSIGIHNALKISDSLKTVEQLLDNDIVPNNIKPFCKVKESDKNCKLREKKSWTLKKKKISSEEKQSNNINVSINEIFVSTSSANDHNYDKI